MRLESQPRISGTSTSIRDSCGMISTAGLDVWRTRLRPDKFMFGILSEKLWADLKIAVSLLGYLSKGT